MKSSCAGLCLEPVADVDERRDDDEVARPRVGAAEPAVVEERVAARAGQRRSGDERGDDRDDRGGDRARDGHRGAVRPGVEARAAIGERRAMLREQEEADARGERARSTAACEPRPSAETVMKTVSGATSGASDPAKRVAQKYATAPVDPGREHGEQQRGADGRHGNRRAVQHVRHLREVVAVVGERGRASGSPADGRARLARLEPDERAAERRGRRP